MTRIVAGSRCGFRPSLSATREQAWLAEAVAGVLGDMIAAVGLRAARERVHFKWSPFVARLEAGGFTGPQARALGDAHEMAFQQALAE